MIAGIDCPSNHQIIQILTAKSIERFVIFH